MNKNPLHTLCIPKGIGAQCREGELNQNINNETI